MTAPTVRKWLGRYLAGGAPALADASSRPARSPRSIAPATALMIVELRQQRLLQRQIARQAGVSASTVSRVLARAGVSDLQPREPVQRYEHEAPGDLLDIDIKKLGRIARPGHRVTGNRRDTVDGVGWEYLFVAVDDHARIAFTAMYPDETKRSAVQFCVVHRARCACAPVTARQRFGVPFERVCSGLPGTGYPTQIYAGVSSADQR